MSLLEPRESPPSLFFISQISPHGLVKIRFSSPIKVIDDFELMIDAAVLLITIETDFSLFDPPEMLSSWKTVSMTEYEVAIQITFSQPELLSAFDEPDKLKIKVLQPLAFMSDESQKPITGGLTFVKEIPRQFVNVTGQESL
jgi:hypothetical protein